MKTKIYITMLCLLLYMGVKMVSCIGKNRSEVKRIGGYGRD